MTIICPNENQKKLYNIALVLLGFIIIALISAGIVMYGDLVNLRHEVNILQKNIQETELASINLQNKVYAIIDTSNLEKIASEKGLIKEKNPDFLNLNIESNKVIAQQETLSL